jgi:hypothetical protein
MYSANEVAKKIDEMKKSGAPLQRVAWQTALLCVGWAYVFGARGEYCDPTNRRRRASVKHPTIQSACKNFNGKDSGPAGCIGCKWYLGSAGADESKHEGRTRFFDCRGFTYWVLLQVYGWQLSGTGATTQWDTASNWAAKGKIATMPKDTLVCLFVRKGNRMEHTGFGYNNETVECSAGVQHFKTRNKKWTHWAVPACVDSATPSPTPPTPSGKPVLRRGDRGAYVTLAQTELIQCGYDCGTYGADGDFGTATENAVRAFQHDHGLSVDGVIGGQTWAALDAAEPAKKYTVTIPHLSKSQADALISQYPGSIITEERG